MSAIESDPPHAAGERFEVDGIVGERWPGTATPIVLLHAGVADRRAWYGVAPRLVGPVLAYDRRGYGDTPAATGRFSHLDDLWTVLDRCLDGPVWLVGNSIGGALALDAALSAPERVAGLILIASAVSGGPELDEESADAATIALAERLEAAGEDHELTARLEAWLWLDGPACPEGRVGGDARTLALDMSRRISAHGGDEDAGASGLDAWSQLEHVGVATTVVACALDVPAIDEQARVIAERIPGARLRRLPGVAHLPGLEAPGTVAALIEEARAGA